MGPARSGGSASALYDFATICFKKRAYGATQPVWVSPQHRILVRGWRAQLHCGEDEVLIATRALIDGQKVIRSPRQEVTYVHILFEDHQILCSHGLLSESYCSAAKLSDGWAEGIALELGELFPGMFAANAPQAVRPVQTARFGTVLRKG